jgi:hypothetical protein
VTPGVESRVLDLKGKDICYKVAEGVEGILQLAADMGGMSFMRTTKRCVC